MQIVVLDAKTIANTDLTPIAKLGTLTSYDMTAYEDILSRCENAEVIITNKVKLDAKLIASLPKLKLICVAATGVNNIELEAAKAHHVAVANVAGYSTPSVVQHTFTMLGNLMTNIHRYQQDCQAGRWQQSPMFCRLDYDISEIAGKHFVIIGHGALGEAVANVAKAFGAKVIIAERKGATQVRNGRMAFTEALRIADIVSIHCPLTAETENLIDDAEFAALQGHAFIINTARGGIVNEQALVNALNNNQIAGAAVDVLTHEPARTDNPLVNYQGDNLLLTPHIAWASKEAIARLVNEIALNINAFASGTDRNRVV
ncbi:D-2-hydroxyacid dehydrogenase [Pseudoalteromonas peptidolytica]|uniref:D-2-hydroxyacid dehydrogenase n=1 Tax=Pseudoalteromonas peptidolytica TaxID=61150 RepID=UPI00298DA813|nr:D-2-hydroxyacid dehydrogenase [Pseudoalteromonas peptidolytica]MDW7547510.1 D-2-hydroxyacid dehydrogenase [Pseudoalteromonas peptidolytica]